MNDCVDGLRLPVCGCVDILYVRDITKQFAYLSADSAEFQDEGRFRLSSSSKPTLFNINDGELRGDECAVCAGMSHSHCGRASRWLAGVVQTVGSLRLTTANRRRMPLLRTPAIHGASASRCAPATRRASGRQA